MKPTRLPCTDERVVLARRGGLDPQAWQDFATHLTTCVDCRIAWRLNADFDGSAASQPGDERLVASAVKRALAPTARRQRSAVRIAVAASAILLVAGAASAAIVLGARVLAPAHEVEPLPGPATHKARRTGAGRTTEPTPATPAPTIPAAAAMPAPTAMAPPTERTLVAPPSTEPEAAPVALGPMTRLPGALVPRPRSKLASARMVGDQTSDVTDRHATAPGLAPPSQFMAPAALFAESLNHRQQGRVDDAIAGFRALARQFPDSAEAKVALVSLGDLLLDAGSAADALTAYEGYLARSPAGTLVPESLWGKARALRLLGRTREAAAARRELARRFPDFPYATGLGAGGITP